MVPLSYDYISENEIADALPMSQTEIMTPKNEPVEPERVPSPNVVESLNFEVEN